MKVVKLFRKTPAMADEDMDLNCIAMGSISETTSPYPVSNKEQSRFHSLFVLVLANPMA